MGLRTQIAVRLTALLTGAPDKGQTRHEIDELIAAVDLESGTGTGQADLLFDDTRTIAASSNETLDLNALTDMLGVTANFVKVKALIVKASAGNTNDVVVGAAASNPFVGPMGGTTPTHTLKPGGVMVWYNPAGWSSANGASDQLKIANSSSGSSVAYDLYIVGTSA